MVTKASRNPNWSVSLIVVDRLYSGTLNDLTNDATHFSRKREGAYWMSDMKVIAIIGSHKFMRKE